MSEENALSAGTILRSGRNVYTIKRVIGAGGFGITYCAGTKLRAGNLEFDVEVAIKEFFMAADCMRDDSTSAMICSKPAQERVSQARKDFLGEARRLNAISSAHPNIVRVNEVFEANNTAYYVMEYLEGQSLADYVASRGGRLSQEETLSIMMPVVDAVAFLHGERITHLDIKPANIMLAVDGSTGTRRPVLIDFGLSKHYDEKGQPTSTVNIHGFSDGYAPPEQYGGIDSFSPAADVYSLSATILYCLTGRRLPKSLSVDQEQIEAEIPAALSADLRAALRGGLQLNARRRTTDAIALRAALMGKTKTAAAPQEATRTMPYDVTQTSPRKEALIDRTPPRAPKPPQKAAGKRPWTMVVAIAAFAIMTAIAAIFIFRDKGNGDSPANWESPVRVEASLPEIEMVEVECGTYNIGTYDWEKPIHSVTVSSFSIGKYEVTQKLWKAVMGTNPSYFKGDNLPVENVSWYQVQEFIRKLNAKTGKHYRLPTEAEWEFAARGGNRSRGYIYSGSNDIGTVAWYDGNSGDKTHPVGTKAPNELGIYDMSGNVLEWCQDWYASNYYSKSPSTNPKGPTTGSNRVVRGGGWYGNAGRCRVSCRLNFTPGAYYGGLGFRLAQ